MKAINEDKKIELNKIKSKFTLNPYTNRYDYNGNLSRDDLWNFKSEDGEGFIINFGEVTGNFNCSSLGRTGLKSLKGAPQKVGGSFGCSSNKLTSLEGAPTEVGGDFSCNFNKLTTLKGAPKTVGGDFSCFGNQLTTLEGAPKIVGGDFRCSYYDYNNPDLHSLDGIGEVRGIIVKDF